MIVLGVMPGLGLIHVHQVVHTVVLTHWKSPEFYIVQADFSTSLSLDSAVDFCSSVWNHTADLYLTKLRTAAGSNVAEAAGCALDRMG